MNVYADERFLQKVILFRILQRELGYMYKGTFG